MCPVRILERLSAHSFENHQHFSDHHSFCYDVTIVHESGYPDSLSGYMHTYALDCSLPSSPQCCVVQFQRRLQVGLIIVNAGRKSCQSKCFAYVLTMQHTGDNHDCVMSLNFVQVVIITWNIQDNRGPVTWKYSTWRTCNAIDKSSFLLSAEWVLFRSRLLPLLGNLDFLLAFIRIENIHF